MEIQSDKEYHRKALALLICFFIAFMYVESVLKPYYQGKAPQQQAGTSTQTAAPASTAAGTPQAVVPATPGTTTGAQASPQQVQPAVPVAGQPQSGYPADSQLVQNGFVRVHTGAFQAKISLLGGRLAGFVLENYKATQESDSAGLDLVVHAEGSPYPLGVYSGDVNDAWTQYRLVAGPESDPKKVVDVAAVGQPVEVTLEGALPDGRTVQKTFSFEPEGYFFSTAVTLSAPSADGKGVALEWTKFIASDDSSLLDPYNVQGFTWFDDEKARREAIGEFEEAQQTMELGKVRWVSLGNKYFMAAMISEDALAPALARKTEQTYRALLAEEPTQAKVKLFVGPKNYEILNDAGMELQRNIDFGKFGVVSAPLLMLLHAFYGVFKNYGLAIVTLTILVRLCLYPLNSASFKQMKKMQDLKPEMDKVREQFKDKQEQQMQLMALYKKHGVNPLGGCLPVVLQMPIFLGLYSALMLAVELRHAPFAGWITDLSAPEKLMIGGVGIPVMVILFVISMIVQQWTTPSQMDPTQKKIMMAMPVGLGFMFASFPSGLTLYWLTSNLISIGQQKGLYLAHDGGKSALKITLTVSVIVFALAFLVTLF